MRRLWIDAHNPTLLSLWVVAALATGCVSSQPHGGASSVNVKIAEANATGTEIFYALPRTVLTVTAPVTIHETRKGKCAQFLSEKICPEGGDSCSTISEALELPAAIESSSTYSLGKLVLASSAEADASRIYQISIPGSSLTERALILELSEAGLLITGDSKAKSKGLELAAGVIKSLAGIVSVLASDEKEVDRNKELCIDTARQILRERATRKKLLERLVAGSSMPAETARLILDPSKTQEEKLLERFVTTSKTSEDVVCEIRLESEDVAAGESFEATLFQVSKMNGVCVDESKVDCSLTHSQEQVTCWVPETMRASQSTAEGPKDPIHRVKLEIEHIADQFSENLRARGVEMAGDGSDRSFFYRVPSFADISLTVERRDSSPVDSQTVLAERSLIAQLGPVASLPGAGLDQVIISLYQDTGALKKVTTQDSPIAIDQITGILDSAKTAIEAEQASDDELARLERERKILEERKKIRDFKEDLGIAEDEP